MYSTRLVALLGALVIGTGTLASGLRAAPISFEVQLNTTAAAIGPGVPSGFLEFLLQPGDTSAPLALASIQGFTGATPLSPQVTGDVQGSLPGMVTLRTTGGAPADLFQEFTFGSLVRFLLVLDGPALTNPNGLVGTTFTFAAYRDANGDPLYSPDGVLATVEIAPNGTVSVARFTSALSMAEVPEPATLSLLGVGLVGLALARRLCG